ncbi:MAG: DUF3426 domain-containing protein, partial [Candidimonas sp.]
NCAYIFDGFEAVVPPDTPVSQQPVQPASAAPGIPHVVRQRAASSAQGVRAEPESAAARPDSRTTGDRPEPQAVARSVRAEPHVHAPFVPGSRAEASFPPGPRSTVPFVAEPRLEVPFPQEPHVGGADDTRNGGPRADAPLPAPERQGGVYVEPRSGSPREDAEPGFLDPPPRRHRGLAFYIWGFLSAVGLVVLLAQCFYVYRAQLAADLPAIRPLLEQACLSLRCQVPYSREIGDITIMNSSLQTRGAANGAPATAQQANNAPSTAQTSTTMVLRVTLRNSFGKPQEWPTLMLDLLDFSGTVVVKKDLPPASYLPPDILGHAFAARSEVTAIIPITMEGVTVSGFQLTKYFS